MPFMLSLPGRGTCMCGIPATCTCTEIAPLSRFAYNGAACQCDVDNCFNQFWEDEGMRVSKASSQ